MRAGPPREPERGQPCPRGSQQHRGIAAVHLVRAAAGDAARMLLIAALLVIGFGARAGESRRLPRSNLLVYTTADDTVASVKTVTDWQKRRAEILANMQRVAGLLPGPEKRCPLDVHAEEEVDCGGYVRRLISYASEPGSRVPAYLLIPKRALTNPDVRVPAVLALHQTHSAGQKVVVGLGQSTNDEYGVALAKRGFVVLAPPYTMLANYWPDLKALGYRSGTMKSIWDNIRGLDLLASLPFVKTNGFGAIGHSLGGHNAVFTGRLRRAHPRHRFELRPGFVSRLLRRRSKELATRAGLVSGAIHAGADELRGPPGGYPIRLP